MDVARQRRDRQSEVSYLHRPVGVDEAVRRFDVAVQNASRLRGIQPADDIEDCGNRFGRRQGAVSRHSILQRAARQQFHGDHRHAGYLLAAEDVDRVGMADRGRQLSFAEEPRAVVGILQPAAQHLQGNPASGLRVFGFVNLAHAALTEQPVNAVRAPHLAGGQALAVGAGRDRLATGRRHRGCVVREADGERLTAGLEETRGAKALGQVVPQRLAAARTTSGEMGAFLHMDRLGQNSPWTRAHPFRCSPSAFRRRRIKIMTRTATLPPIKPPRMPAESRRFAPTRPSTTPTATAYTSTIAMIVPNPSTLALFVIGARVPSCRD